MCVLYILGFDAVVLLGCRKAEEGLARVWRDDSGVGTVSLISNKGLMAYGMYGAMTSCISISTLPLIYDKGFMAYGTAL